MLGTLYLETDRPAESEEASERAVAHDPKLPRRHQVQLNNLAWYLVTAPVPTARNPIRGLELALRAVSLAPSSWETCNTLGVAYYRNARWDEALRALETSISRTRGVNAFDGFFLAMAHWKLGHADEAHDWLLRSEEWRLCHQPENVELLRFRAEAERLIGVWANPRREAPALPASILEALNDPSFRLPRKPLHQCEQEGTAAEPSRKIEGKVNELAIIDFAEHVLFFIDMT